MNNALTIKPIVRYRGLAVMVGKGMVGSRAILMPVDHPNPYGLVSNERKVMTSPIVSCDPTTGRIETQNTLYIPMENQLC